MHKEEIDIIMIQVNLIDNTDRVKVNTSKA